MHLKEKVKNLPLLPGVYLMKNSDGKIIYVGKAKNLKNRVSTYFHQNKQHSKKVLRLVRSIADFEIVVVDTELDALLLECQLIQHYRPIYNRRMNYFDNYNYLHIQSDGFFSRIFLPQELTDLFAFIKKCLVSFESSKKTIKCLGFLKSVIWRYKSNFLK